MIQQLVQRLVDATATFEPGVTDKVQRLRLAADQVLRADPLDLILYMEEAWDRSEPKTPGERSAARETFYGTSAFHTWTPVSTSAAFPPWDHFAYSYVLENTRVVQILRKVVREYRSGENLGVATSATRRWIEATESLLFGAGNPLTAWLSTSQIRQDSEAVRRNAYWRMFGLDLGFGRDDNSPPVYEKAQASNTSFTALFEELLYELWQAISNINNWSGANQSDDDRIYRIAEQLRFILNARRQNDMLRREELSAAAALGWADLTLSYDSPVVADLAADATNAGDRLRMIGERVGMPAHTKSAAFFSMAGPISALLRAIEAGFVSGPDKAWLLYTIEPKTLNGEMPFGSDARRVITEWGAATGKDLKVRGKPVETRPPRLVAVN
jgi:hypothetical protein